MGYLGEVLPGEELASCCILIGHVCADTQEQRGVKRMAVKIVGVGSLILDDFLGPGVKIDLTASCQ